MRSASSRHTATRGTIGSSAGGRRTLVVSRPTDQGRLGRPRASVRDVFVDLCICMSASTSISLRMGDVILGGGKEMGRGVVEHAGGFISEGWKEKGEVQGRNRRTYELHNRHNSFTHFELLHMHLFPFRALPCPRLCLCPPSLSSKSMTTAKPPDPAARSPNTLLSSTVTSQV